jgi:hypothetical protein
MQHGLRGSTRGEFRSNALASGRQVMRQRAAAAANNDDVIVSTAHEVSSLTVMSFEIDWECTPKTGLQVLFETVQELLAKPITVNTRAPRIEIIPATMTASERRRSSSQDQ